MIMKSIFNESTLEVRQGISGNIWTLYQPLIKNGFSLDIGKGLGDENRFTLNYPLYTSRDEAKTIYRQVQNELKLKLASNNAN